MSAQGKVRLEVEQLPDRILPSATATFSNGLLLVRGDNQGDNLVVSADSSGVIHVTERGQAVQIVGATQATLANTSIVIEQSGAGLDNVLSTDKSLGTIKTFLDATTGTNNVLNPGNVGSSTEMGGKGINHLISGPGPDVLIGGADSTSNNFFDWQPGTGTDVVIGRGPKNTLLVVGNNAGKGENDQVIVDGQGGFIYQRLNVVPFQIFASHIDTLVIQPSTGNDTVTVGDLSSVKGLHRIEVDGRGGNDTVDFSAQKNTAVTAIFNGGGGASTFIAGAGPNRVINPAPDTIILPAGSGALTEVFVKAGQKAPSVLDSLYAELALDLPNAPGTPGS
jgi:hypothetical protein